LDGTQGPRLNNAVPQGRAGKDLLERVNTAFDVIAGMDMQRDKSHKVAVT
jgi:hypothetical protein